MMEPSREIGTIRLRDCDSLLLTTYSTYQRRVQGENQDTLDGTPECGEFRVVVTLVDAGNPRQVPVRQQSRSRIVRIIVQLNMLGIGSKQRSSVERHSLF